MPVSPLATHGLDRRLAAGPPHFLFFFLRFFLSFLEFPMHFLPLQYGQDMSNTPRSAASFQDVRAVSGETRIE